jgi:hypothetical protein
MKSRTVINKPSNVACAICQKEVSLYSLSSHIKYAHSLTSDEYAAQYGEFRKPKRPPTNRDIKVVECGICGKSMSSVGMFTHLRDTHQTTPDLYVIDHGEYRPSKLRVMSYADRVETVSDDEKQTCVLCGRIFASGNILGGHIKRDHMMTKKDYIINHVLKGVRPLCKCGCGRKTRLLRCPPYHTDYISGHNSAGSGNSMFGKHFSPESRKKMSLSAVNRMENYVGKKIDTKPELDFKSVLDRLGIEYVHPYSVDMGDRFASVDFFLPEKDLLVEIDGEYWHPKVMENLNFHRLPNVISDRQRDNRLHNLARLRENDIPEFIECASNKESALEHLIKLAPTSRVPSSISYNQVIISKDYFKSCYDNGKEDYVKSNAPLILRFIRLFHPEFPYPHLSENIHDVIHGISTYDLSGIYSEATNEFQNNIFALGHNYLKHHFRSYWGSRFTDNISPIQAWSNDKIMQEVINYRIGLNKSREIHDLSLYQIIKGMFSRRIGVSFFKPLLAAAIYKHYLGSNPAPVVLDPCCGFGGRLLGFKSMYPMGTYIGCEPNPETFAELQQLVIDARWTNVQIFNCKFEDFVHSGTEFDLMFTSIPYYDAEIYSRSVSYESFDQWHRTFIRSIESFSPAKTKLINVPHDVATRLKWNNVSSYISSQRTHFDKRKNGNRDKRELLVQL